MACYIVIYDLFTQGQNSDCLIKKLATYGTYWHMQDAIWIIATDDSAATVRANLGGCLGEKDTLFVGSLGHDAAWLGYRKKPDEWLRMVL